MSIKEQLIGSWRLISQETRYVDGRREATRGTHPDGILIYDAYGNLSVQLVRSGEPYETLNLADFDTAMEQYHGYFGTYEVDETAGIVYHHIVGAAFLPYRGTSQVRHFKLEGNRLTLYAEATTPGDDTARYIIWERLDGAYR